MSCRRSALWSPFGKHPFPRERWVQWCVGLTGMGLWHGLGKPCGLQFIGSQRVGPGWAHTTHERTGTRGRGYSDEIVCPFRRSNHYFSSSSCSSVLFRPPALFPFRKYWTLHCLRILRVPLSHEPSGFQISLKIKLTANSLQYVRSWQIQLVLFTQSAKLEDGEVIFHTVHNPAPMFSHCDCMCGTQSHTHREQTIEKWVFIYII